MVAIDALPIDKLSPDTLLTFSLDKFKGSVTLPVLLMVVTPAVVDKLIPLPAARFPPMSPVLARLSPSGLLSPLLLPHHPRLHQSSLSLHDPLPVSH